MNQTNYDFAFSARLVRFGVKAASFTALAGMVGATTGCLPAQPRVTTSIEVDDPRAVTVQQVRPWNGTEMTVAREPSGALVALSKSEPSQVLVTHEGTFTLRNEDANLRLDGDPISLWLTYQAAGEGSHGTPKILGQVSLTVPKSQLLQIRERRTPPRTAGPVFLGLGVVFLGAAGLAGYGAGTGDLTTGERVGLGALTALLAGVASFSLIEGGYRIFGTEEDRVLFRASERKTEYVR